MTVTVRTTVTKTTTITVAPSPPAASPSPTGPATTINSDGTYLVGVDIAPGQYRSSGSASCYRARRSDTSGSVDGIIASDLTSGQAVVTIAASDKAFVTKRCGTWSRTG